VVWQPSYVCPRRFHVRGHVWVGGWGYGLVMGEGTCVVMVRTERRGESIGVLGMVQFTSLSRTRQLIHETRVPVIYLTSAGWRGQRATDGMRLEHMSEQCMAYRSVPSNLSLAALVTEETVSVGEVILPLRLALPLIVLYRRGKQRPLPQHGTVGEESSGKSGWSVMETRSRRVRVLGWSHHRCTVHPNCLGRVSDPQNATRNYHAIIGYIRFRFD
jgi:hypothetical protein